MTRCNVSSVVFLAALGSRPWSLGTADYYSDIANRLDVRPGNSDELSRKARLDSFCSPAHL